MVPSAVIGHLFKTYAENASIRRSTRQYEFSPIEIISGSHAFTPKERSAVTSDESYTYNIHTIHNVHIMLYNIVIIL